VFQTVPLPIIKNEFEKLVHLVGFITRTYMDCPSIKPRPLQWQTGGLNAQVLKIFNKTFVLHMIQREIP